MFIYHQSKGNLWGAATRPFNGLQSLARMHQFFQKYYLPLEVKGLTVHLRLDLNDPVGRKLRQDFVQVVGDTPMTDATDWILQPNQYAAAMDFLTSPQAWPKKLKNPVWVDFETQAGWNEARLPAVQWYPEYEGPPMGTLELKKTWYQVHIQDRGLIQFMLGITIPIPVDNPAAYDFLREFCADAPFKINPEKISVSTPVGKKGKWAFRKPSPEIAARIAAAVGAAAD
ncbi:MAG TPA: hypothetical protein VF607_12345 [Verrucomicrobiae bacterium]